MMTINTTKRWQERIAVALYVLMLSSFSNLVVALPRPDEKRPGPRIRIAVMDRYGTLEGLQTTYTPNNFSPDQTVLPQVDVARGLTEMLTTELVKTDRFIVLERAALQQIIGEQDFAASDRANRDTAVSRNLTTSAQALITGEVTEFNYERTNVSGGLNIAGFGVKVARTTAVVALHIRVIDVATGEVIFSDRFKGTSSSTGVSSDIQQVANFGAKAGRPLANAAQKAIEKAVVAIASSMNKFEWAGRLVDVRGNEIYVNAGSESGIEAGMELAVYERQEALVDPETGRVLGSPERRIGMITIVAVKDKYSIAQLRGGEAMKRGNIVRLAENHSRLAKR